MQWRQKFLLLSRDKQIAIAVVSIHFFILFSLLIHHWVTLKPKPMRSIAVRNIVLSQEKESEPIKVAKHTSPPLPQIKLPKIEPEKPKATTPSKKTALPTVKTKPSTPKPLPKFDEAPKKTELKLPSLISVKPKANRTVEVENPSLKELIVAQLQEALDLPEYGEVKEKLEIDPLGRLVDCEIIDAKSKKNAEFLKNRLPELSFPCLNESQSFTIVFKNVEIR